MAIDIESEHLLTLPDVAKGLPTRRGKRIHATTIWRWTRRGLDGVRLEAIRIGGTTYTTQEALQRFAARLSERRGLSHGSPALPRSELRSHHRAEARLRKEGFASEATMTS